MATGGAGRIYEEDDLVDEYLPNQLSKWTFHHSLVALSRHLGITEDEINDMMTISNTPEAQILQVQLMYTCSGNCKCNRLFQILSKKIHLIQLIRQQRNSNRKKSPNLLINSWTYSNRAVPRNLDTTRVRQALAKLVDLTGFISA